MKSLASFSDLGGRILLAAIFVASGLGKIAAYAGTQQYMAAHGAPGALLPLVIATEVGGGAMIVLGLFTRYAAVALAGFSVLTALMFHADFSDQMQQINFLKNLAIAGAFFTMAAHGAGRLSLDARRAAA